MSIYLPPTLYVKEVKKKQKLIHTQRYNMIKVVLIERKTEIGSAKVEYTKKEKERRSMQIKNSLCKIEIQ